MFFYSNTVAHDKGKPAARQGRKAVSLPTRACRETVWLPKAIGESRPASPSDGIEWEELGRRRDHARSTLLLQP